jgi:hypothetical protein
VKFGCVTSGTTYTVDMGVENVDDGPTASTDIAMAPTELLYIYCKSIVLAQYVCMCRTEYGDSMKVVFGFVAVTFIA